MRVKRLLVSDESGAINIMQQQANARVIDGYHGDNLDAAFFEFDLGQLDRLFVDKSRLRKRERMLCSINKTRVRADGQDEILIHGAPIGAIVTVRHGRTVISEPVDGIIHLVAPLPGPWEVEIEHPAYVTQTFRIVAQ